MFRLVFPAAITYVLNAAVLATGATVHVDAGCESDVVGLFQLWSWSSVRDVEPTPEPTPRQSLLHLALGDVAEQARAKLEAGTAEGATGFGGSGSRFSAIDISFPYASGGFAEGSKSFFSKSVLTHGGRHCVVYGIDGHDWRFEESMAEAGCETHVFDCGSSPRETVSSAGRIEFHDWCIGGAHGRAGVDATDMSEKKFLSLAETMERLQHSSVDILRFDLEGSEWDFLKDEVIKSASPPAQLIFELHSSGADPNRASPSLVESHGFREVNQLLLALHDDGYRVVSKEVDAGDACSSEFSLVRVRQGNS